MQFMFFNLILKSWKLFSRFLFLLIVLRVLLKPIRQWYHPDLIVISRMLRLKPWPYRQVGVLCTVLNQFNLLRKLEDADGDIISSFPS